MTTSPQENDDTTRNLRDPDEESAERSGTDVGGEAGSPQSGVEGAVTGSGDPDANPEEQTKNPL
jgi:hypothetical protein